MGGKEKSERELAGEREEEYKEKSEANWGENGPEGKSCCNNNVVEISLICLFEMVANIPNLEAWQPDRLSDNRVNSCLHKVHGQLGRGGYCETCPRSANSPRSHCRESRARVRSPKNH